MNSEFDAPSLEFVPSLMNAAGSLGFAPDQRESMDLSKFGAFVTNPISARARNVATQLKLMSFPGGVLIHTGYPNPGLSRTIKQHASAWARAPIPIIVHLLTGKPEEIRKAVLRIEELENVMAVELGIEADSATELISDLVHASMGELPLIVQVPFTRSFEVTEIATKAGASAISLGAPRGAIQAKDGKLVSGRLYGPAIFPQALEMVRQLSKAGYKVIGAGGVERAANAETMLSAGAIAVQMDVSLWRADTSDIIG